MFSFNPFHTRGLSNSKQQALEDKNLHVLLESERKIEKEWIKLADDRRVAANQLKLFGRPLGDDMTDVTSKLGDLMIEWAEVMTDFAGQYEQYRTTMKSIADKEAPLLSSRDKRTRLQETIRKHAENHPGQVDKLMDLKQQLSEHDQANLEPETEASNFQRIATREAMYILLNGIHEMASKMDIIASFGKYVVDELDVTPVQPGDTRPAYHGTEQTTRIIKDAKRCIANWRPDSTTLRRTLTSHHGQNPLVVVAPDSPVKDKKLPRLPTDGEEEHHSPAASANSSGRSSPTSFHSTHSGSPVIYKPDEVVVVPSPPPTTCYPPAPHVMPYADGPHNNNNNYPPLGPGGFSPFVLEQQQQSMYQFYQHYTPPRPYEDMARQQRQLHPSPQHSPFLGPGGFVLPTVNPNFPQSSSSTGTKRSSSPASMLEPLVIPTPAAAAEPTSSPELSPSSLLELNEKSQPSP